MYDDEAKVDVSPVEIPEFTPEFLKDTGMYADEHDVQLPATLNRKERRAQAKKLKQIQKRLDKNRSIDKAVDLSPEDKMKVYASLLEKVKAKNAEFEKMKEEGKIDE